jgi:hypothetical protein
LRVSTHADFETNWFILYPDTPQYPMSQELIIIIASSLTILSIVFVGLTLEDRKRLIKIIKAERSKRAQAVKERDEMIPVLQHVDAQMQEQEDTIRDLRTTLEAHRVEENNTKQ